MDFLPDVILHEIFLKAILPADYISEVTTSLGNIYLVCKQWAKILDSPRSTMLYRSLFANFCLGYTNSSFLDGKTARALLTRSAKIPSPEKYETVVNHDLIWFDKVIRTTKEPRHLTIPNRVRIYSYKSGTKSIIKEIEAKSADVYGKYLYICKDHPDEHIIYTDGNIDEPYFVYSTIGGNGTITDGPTGLSLVICGYWEVIQIVMIRDVEDRGGARKGEIFEKSHPNIGKTVNAIFPNGFLFGRSSGSRYQDFELYDLKTKTSRQVVCIDGLLTRIFVYKGVGFGITDDNCVIGFMLNSSDEVIWSHLIDDDTSIVYLGLGYGCVVQRDPAYRSGMIFEVLTGKIVKRLTSDEVTELLGRLIYLKLGISDDFGYRLTYLD